VDSRVVSATNTDIAKAIREGTFREDLYYRTSVIAIHLPPLRERGSDIMLLANLFLRRFCEGSNRKVRGFSSTAVEWIESHDWPGNVRELENRVQRAVIMSDSPLLEPADLGFMDAPAICAVPVAGKLTLRDARDRVERDLIALAIKTERQHRKGCRCSGVSRPTLYDLMKKHGLNA